MKFNIYYFFATILLFLIEVSIATVFKNIFWLRAYFGDVLVVVLIYTFFLSFFEIKNKTKFIWGIFVFSCLIELAQYFHFGEILGLKDHKIAMIVLGNSFSWIDIFCYFAGCIILWLFVFFTKSDSGLAQ